MKKLLFCVMVGVVAMSYARADDTARIKAACQASDKTLWVERNQVCIPRNPCNSSDQNILKYCNDTFRNVQTNAEGYMVLVDLYAQTHNLSCVPVEQKAKLVGQDDVICMGEDVMVFEFDDIRDHPLPWQQPQGEGGTGKWRHDLCTAAGGGMPTCESFSACECKGISETQCNLIENVLRKYGIHGREGHAAGWNITNALQGCWLSDYGWSDYTPDYFSGDGKSHYLF